MATRAAVSYAENLSDHAVTHQSPGARALPYIMIPLLSLLFGLPHLLTPRLLKNHDYTPFALTGVSAITFDETALYAAQANYTFLRWKPAYDTDAYEHKDVPSVVPTVPYFILSAMAHVLGGVDRAFMACDFILPPVAFYLLFLLLLSITSDRMIALLGSTATLLVSFGPRNFIYSAVDLIARGKIAEMQPLEFSRLLHPEFSFTILLAALLFLWRTLKTSRTRDALLAGFFGGLLFYFYIYYWLPWIGTCLILLVMCAFMAQTKKTPLLIVNVTTWVVGGYFWLRYFQAQQFPNASWILERFNVELGHAIRPEKMPFTVVYTLIFGLFVLLFTKMVVPRSTEKSETRPVHVLLFHSAIFVAALGALNIEIVTGKNILALPHYPGKLFQPFLSIALFTLVVPIAPLYLKARTCWLRKSWPVIAGVSVSILLATGVCRQVAVSANTAPYQVQPPQFKALFSWLNEHATLDDVLIASDIEMNTLVPVLTHNRVYVPNGARTMASNQEIEHRFLVAMKLLGHSSEDIRRMLSQDASQSTGAVSHTYTFYLFLGGNGQIHRRLPDETISRILQRYEALDLSREMRAFRANYVYVQPDEKLQPVAGWRFDNVFTDQFGSLKKMQADQRPDNPSAAADQGRN